MTGKLAPESENPVPVTEAELTVTAACPLDVKVTVCVAWEPTATSPNETFVALMLRFAVAGLSCSV